MLADRDVLAQAARSAEAVINAANADNSEVLDAILPALAGSGKPFLQTSGSSIVGDNAGGEPTDKVYDEDAPLTPLADKARGSRSMTACGQRRGTGCAAWSSARP